MEEKKYTKKEITDYIQKVIERQNYDSKWINESGEKCITTDVSYAIDGLEELIKEIDRVL